MGQEFSTRRNLLAAGAVFIAFAMIATLTYTWQTGQDDPVADSDEVASSDSTAVEGNEIEDFQPEDVDGSEVDERADSELDDHSLAEGSDADVDDPLDADVSVRPSSDETPSDSAPAAPGQSAPPSRQDDEAAEDAGPTSGSDDDSGSAPSDSGSGDDGESTPPSAVPTSDDLEDRVEVTRVSPPAVADLSPFGVGMDLDIAPGEEPMGPFMVEVAFDPNEVPYGGDAIGRMQLVLHDGCRPNGGQKLECAVVQPLVTSVDAEAGVVTAMIDQEKVNNAFAAIVDQQLEAGRDPVEFSMLDGDKLSQSAQAEVQEVSVAAAETPWIHPTVLRHEDVPQFQVAPVVDEAASCTQCLALTTGGRSLSGDYSATAIESLSSWEVALSTGSAEASYEIPVPPAAAGPEPDIGFTYSSGSIDGLNAGRNTQSGPIGLGWTMMAGGSVAREVEPCGIENVAAEDKCLLGNGTDVSEENFSITLNGVSSSLVRLEGDEFRLQNDPMWRVFRRFDASHGYAKSESWEVVTPDGTRWLFGTDKTSARYVPAYYGRLAADERPCDDDMALCDTVYQWDLRRVVDTSGNVMEFHYLQEGNHYNARGSEIRPYTRNAVLTEITYGAFDPAEALDPGKAEAKDANARVKLNWELRCNGWGLISECQFPNDFLDTPADRWCPTPETPCTDRLSPTFWTQLRLGSIQTQIRQTDGSWVTDSAHDLIQYFPSAIADDDGDENQPKMVLARIVQRPNGIGDEAWRHYGLSPILARDYDSIHARGAEVIDTAGDIGFGSGVDRLGGDDRVRFDDVWLGGANEGDSIASQVSIRYASKSAGKVTVLIDGEEQATLDLPSTGSRSSFATVSAEVTPKADVGDVELWFRGGPLSDRVTWFQFSLPADDFDGLPGLPPVQYVDTGAENQDAFAWLPNRVNAPDGIPDMKLPRIKSIENELGGLVDFTYGQTKPCPEDDQPDFYFDQFDCYGGFFGGDGEDAGDTVLWEKWKVLSTTVTPGADQPPMTTTYDYVGDPQWAHQKIGSTCEGFFNDWRGHNVVRVTDAAGVTEYRFFTGMDNAGSQCDSAPTWTNRQLATKDGSESFDNPRILHGQQYEMVRMELDGTERERELTQFDVARDGFADGDEKGIFITAGSGDQAARFIAPWRIETTSSGSNDKTSRVDYLYDVHGNVLTEFQRGDVDSDSDDRRLETEFVKNVDKWIVSTPCRERVISGVADGETVSETRMGYDAERGQESDTACSQEPSRGLVTSEWSFTDESSASQSSSGYNERGQLIDATDPNGNQTTFHLDPLQGWLRTEVNPLGWRTEYDYDDIGRQISVSDVNQKVSRLSYDNFDRLSTVVLPGNKTGDPSYRFDYDVEARPIKVTSRQLFDDTESGDDRYLISVSYMDGLGRDIQMQARAQADGNRWISAAYFDDAGRLARHSTAFEQPGEVEASDYFAPNWETVPLRHEYSYDARGEMTRDRTIGTAEGQDSTDWDIDYAYDGWTTRVYDESAELGYRTDYTYDAFGNLATVVEYEGQGDSATEYARSIHTYDAAERLLTSTDADSNVTSMTYDRQGRRTTLDDPSLGEWRFGYDPNGNMTLQRDAREVWLRFDYDPLDRLTKRQESNESASGGQPLAEFHYDNPSTGRDRLHRSRSFTPDGTLDVVNLAYDEEGLLLHQQTVVPGEFGGTFNQHFTYGLAGQQLSIRYPANAGGDTGELVSTDFDNRTGLPVGLASDIQGVLVNDTVYGSDGQRRSRTYGPSGEAAVERWEVDARTERTTSYEAGVGGSASNVVAMSYSYDQRGNTTSIVDRVNAGQTQCLSYDSFSRLTTAFTGAEGCGGHDASIGESPFDEEHQYRRNHSLSSKTGLGVYTYGGDGAGPLQVTATESGNQYGYDANGNQTMRTVDGVAQTLTFDSDNRLATVTTGGDGKGGVCYVAKFDGTKLVGSQGAEQEQPPPVDLVGLAAGGTYDLTFVSSDPAHPDAPDQPQEQWFIEGLDHAGHVVFTTVDSPTDDLPVGDTTNTTTVRDVNIGAAVSIRARLFTAKDSFNSVAPVSVSFSSDSCDNAGSGGPGEPSSGSDGGDTVERYLYDADGMRIVRIQGREAVVYVGDTFEWRSDDQTRSQVSHYYLGGRRVAVSEGGDTKYVFNDHLNSAAALASSINDIEIGRYTPWGENRGDPIGGHLSYNSQRLSQVTDLLDYGMRFYDPSLGRFISPDQAVPDFNDPVALNRYTHAMNNPMTFYDPNGEWGLSSIKKTVKKAGGAVSKAAKKTVEAAKKIDVHTALDVAGMVPVIGEFADAANAGLYLLKGDYANAALSAASMIPIAGNAATAARLCKKLCDDVAQGVSKGAKKLAERSAKRSAKSSTSNLATKCAASNSFVPGTKVLMADGSLAAIEDVKVGNVVQSYSTEAGEETVGVVTAAIVGSGNKEVVTLKTGLVSITATSNHPFWSVSSGSWLKAGRLDPGDVLLDSNGDPDAILAVERQKRSRTTVHNLTIAGTHTYYVGVDDRSYLNHNCDVAFLKNVAKIADREVNKQVAASGKRVSARTLGTMKHKHAEDLINRYQTKIRHRGLETEISFRGGLLSRYGARGSVRLDVFQSSTGRVWDFKFGRAGLRSRQLRRILRNTPGATSVTVIRP